MQYVSKHPAGCIGQVQGLLSTEAQMVSKTLSLALSGPQDWTLQPALPAVPPSCQGFLT